MDPEDGNKNARQVAVALKADGWSRHAAGTIPKITAIGHGKTAEQILALAFANDVKVREDGDLATILAAMDIDSPVPLEALSAVGEILSYLYHMDRSEAEQALQSSPDAESPNAESEL